MKMAAEVRTTKGSQNPKGLLESSSINFTVNGQACNGTELKFLSSRSNLKSVNSQSNYLLI